MNIPDWLRIVRDDLERLRHDHLYRERRTVKPVDATHVEIEGRTYVNFASNDYLGLTHHPRVIEAAAAALRRDGAGSGAAPLITGYGPAHAAAEAALARWKGTESAVLLSSGYQANAAAVQTLAAIGERSAERRGGVRFLLDKFCHASLVDAVRASSRPFRVVPHNGLSKLRRLLEESDPNELQVVVTESVFSMDGDTADLPGLAELKRDRPFVLLLDEAHGSGVYGPNGSGYAAELGLQEQVDVTIVTLSKALGCAGGAVCAAEAFCEAVVNYGRPYVYSTALPPSVAAGAEAAIRVLGEEPQRQAGLRDLASRVRSELRAAGLALPEGDSPILPVILGAEATALDAADRLRREGLLTLAIRPPTVPKGSSRLRITLSAEHSEEDVHRLIRALEDLPRPATLGEAGEGRSPEARETATE